MSGGLGARAKVIITDMDRAEVKKALRAKRSTRNMSIDRQKNGRSRVRVTIAPNKRPTIGPYDLELDAIRHERRRSSS
jgi:hypothetical protein